MSGVSEHQEDTGQVRSGSCTFTTMPESSNLCTPQPHIDRSVCCKGMRQVPRLQRLVQCGGGACTVVTQFWVHLPNVPSRISCRAHIQSAFESLLYQAFQLSFFLACARARSALDSCLADDRGLCTGIDARTS
jgi:hypothetical protein